MHMVEGSRFDLPVRQFKEGISDRVANGFKAVMERWREALITTTALTTACANENSFLYSFTRLPKSDQIFWTGLAVGCILLGSVLAYSVVSTLNDRS